jgi:hypothetical protein
MTARLVSVASKPSPRRACAPSSPFHQTWRRLEEAGHSITILEDLAEHFRAASAVARLEKREAKRPRLQAAQKPLEGQRKAQCQVASPVNIQRMLTETEGTVHPSPPCIDMAYGH